MNKTPTLFATIFVIFAMLRATTSEAEQLSYTIAISESNPRFARIEARFILEGQHIRMHPYGIPGNIKNGWARFVRNLFIISTNGNKIEATLDANEALWRVSAEPGQELSLTYEVHLEHDNYNWSAAGGIDARPALVGRDVIFYIARGLLIYPVGEAPKHSTITFDVPEDWTISTAWEPVAGTKHAYRANGLDELVSNVLMLGRHRQLQFAYGNTKITLALTEGMAVWQGLLRNTLKPIFDQYIGIFGGSAEANYLIVVSEAPYDDGEAYNNSFHQIFLNRDLDRRKLSWANILAHELFHIWNGAGRIISSDLAGQSWFSEGFTDYFANITLVRTGTITQEQFLELLDGHVDQYLSARALLSSKKNLSLVQAGQDKFSHRPLVYDGGTVTAFCLDIEIRGHTNHKKSPNDVMHQMEIRYGQTGKRFSLKDLIAVVNDVAGHDLTPFFGAYIQGSATLPLQEYLDKAGLKLGGFPNSSQVKYNSDPTSGQERMLVRLFSH